MIQFDNGPAGGDYVRYIEQLVAERLLIPSMKQGEGLPPGVSGPTTTAAPSAQPARRPLAPPPPAPRLSPTQANAIATSLMTPSREAGEVPRRDVDPGLWLDVLAIVAGVGIALFGLFSSQASIIFIAVGAGLILSRVKRIVERRSQALVATNSVAARQTFGNPPRNP